MTMLRTLVVDDEPLARKLLVASLEDIPEVEVVGECKNGREAVEATLELNPDLMFLDIQMPGMNGFDVVNALQADVMPMVVFATAYDRYALDAFDVHAVDYVLKPLDEERLQRAVDRAIDRSKALETEGANKSPLVGAIDAIARKIHSEAIDGDRVSEPGRMEGSTRKIVIKDSETVTMVPECDIDWVDAAGDYMCVHVKGKTHIMRSTMKELLAKLNPSVFKRVHRSTIANLERIEQVTPHAKGEYFLSLDCGERLKVSRNYRDAIKQFLSGAS